MNAIETRQYEMLQRVLEFGNTHRHLFPDPGVARDTFAALGAAITELAATDGAKRSASASARVGRKDAARKALVELLVKVNQTVRVLRADGHAVPAFELPDPRTDQALVATGHQFVREAVPVQAELAAHGMLLKTIADGVTALEGAVRDRGVGRSRQVAARTRIAELLASSLAHVRRLDVIINNELARDNVIQAVWKRARRVEDARRPRSSAAVTETPASAAVAEAEAPQPAVG